ncbi:MAG TPA: serine/threonine-protein kinase, partial [Blastocatellia bacterium]|nr:serine/threonine-protein kinase [Blastocatellia bacterium]
MESLLASDERAGDFIESSPLKIAAELLGENQPCLREGQRIGHYEVVTLVGRGGMGEVYLARDLKLNRKVALKLLPPLFAEDAQRAHRFLQEAQALSTLNHPNIVVVHDANFKGDLHFIITEFIEGETLRQRLARAKPTLSEAFEIVIQIARGLEAAHKAGIIHRDIKPENIMIREDGHVKLLDFGVAKLAERHSILSNAAGQLTSGVYTDSAVIIGTARYMSPEQARGHEVDSRTDIFSLGVILYEIIAGRPPFEGGTVGDIIAVHLTSEPRPLFPEMSPFFAGVERIVARALSKEATERYQHIREFLEDLGRLKSVSEWGDQASVPVEDRPPLRNLPVPEPARDPAENRRTFFAGAAYKARLMTRSASLNPYKWNPRLRFYMASTGLLLLAGLVLLALNTGHSAGVKQPIDSLAVLPLALEEGDTDMQYLSDGITESIISNLSQLSRLKVMSRSSVFQFKGRDISPSDAGRALKVRAVLLGRVARRGRAVVISLELVDTED